MMKPILSIENLNIERDKFILKDICWQINSGENWVILGANGSGKTSLLKSIAGYFPPSSGKLKIFGSTFGQSDWNLVRPRIGFVSASIKQRIEDSEPAIDVVISGKYAQVNYWGRIFKKDKQKAVGLMMSLNYGYLADKNWFTLSQGERQRLLIARALMANSELLILDEPCAGLDPVAREHFLETVNQLSHTRPDLPIILVTHHVEEITTAFNRALILKQGRIISSGPIKKALNSRHLSRAFSTPIRLRTSNGRHRLLI